jgi:ribosomal protein S18 acetylase RimI-like enzyme
MTDSIERLGTIASNDTQDLYFIRTGIADEHIDVVINAANTDPDIEKNTSDKRRFANRYAYDAWLSKGRSIFTLVAPDATLAGLIWLGADQAKEPASYTDGPVDLSEWGITFAIRTYPPHRGRGLAVPFIRSAIDVFVKSDAYANAPHKGIWLEVVAENVAAVRSYEKVGFRTVGVNAEGEFLMLMREYRPVR